MPSQIQIKCVRGLGDREAPPISDTMIVTENMGVKRGKRFLDDPSQGGYYVVTKRTLKTVHKSSAVLPTKWITVSDSHLGLKSEKLKVKDYSIEITQNSVWATIATEQYRER
jgi:hypothetical protein